MSFAVNNRLLQGLRPSRLLIFFLIFWLLCALFLFFHLQFLKNQIQKLEVQRLELGLDTYLRRSGVNSGGKFVLESEPSQEVGFIRLVRGREQLLLTGKGTMNFTGLVDLDPDAHGVWIDLLQPEKSGTWILLSRKISGGVVQAGNDDRSAGFAIYKRAVSVSFWSFCLASIPSLLLSLFFTSLARQPLQELEDDMERALQQRSLPLPEHRHKNAELAPLYQQLNRVFLQNRQLIEEMQSSLDNVAHDLRTPMSRLRAVAEYALQSERSEPELYRNALSDCLEESERVMSMLKVMMSVAEAEAGTMRLELEELDLMKTLEDVISLYQYVAEEEVTSQ
jgi:hypothetical protein